VQQSPLTVQEPPEPLQLAWQVWVAVSQLLEQQSPLAVQALPFAAQGGGAQRWVVPSQ
jgi:hypothetical protein